MFNVDMDFRKNKHTLTLKKLTDFKKNPTKLQRSIILSIGLIWWQQNSMLEYMRFSIGICFSLMTENEYFYLINAADVLQFFSPSGARRNANTGTENTGKCKGIQEMR